MYHTWPIISRSLYFFTLFFTEVFNQDRLLLNNLCNKQGHLSLKSESGFKSRAGYNDACMVEMFLAVQLEMHPKTHRPKAECRCSKRDGANHYAKTCKYQTSIYLFFDVGCKLDMNISTHFSILEFHFCRMDHLHQWPEVHSF